jgi:hypothetical protein
MIRALVKLRNQFGANTPVFVWDRDVDELRPAEAFVALVGPDPWGRLTTFAQPSDDTHQAVVIE